MANEKNLTPFTSAQSREEAVKNGRKGGIQSGKSRRKKADFRKVLNTLMQMNIDAGDITVMLESMGMEKTVENTVNFALVMQAISGDVKAYKEIRATLGLSDKTSLDEKEQKMRIKQISGDEEKDTSGLKSFIEAVTPSEEFVKELYGDEAAEEE